MNVWFSQQSKTLLINQTVISHNFLSEYDRLTSKMTLACRRCQDMLIIVPKALTNRWPAYIKSLFKVRVT